MYEVIIMNNPQCKDCQSYIQHYALIEGKIVRIFCGHCIHKWSRKKRPDAAVCENFIPGPGDSERFVSREYLTKKLLDRILSLALLPEITNATEGTEE